MNKIGLRKEEKAFEARVAIVPSHVKQLKAEHGIEILVEPSNQRAFNPDEFHFSESVGISIEEMEGFDVFLNEIEDD